MQSHYLSSNVLWNRCKIFNPKKGLEKSHPHWYIFFLSRVHLFLIYLRFHGYHFYIMFFWHCCNQSIFYGFFVWLVGWLVGWFFGPEGRQLKFLEAGFEVSLDGGVKDRECHLDTFFGLYFKCLWWWHKSYDWVLEQSIEVCNFSHRVICFLDNFENDLGS